MVVRAFARLTPVVLLLLLAGAASGQTSNEGPGINDREFGEVR